jgi:hypothetical protein
MTNEHVEFVPEQSPCQPEKLLPVLGVAVNVTVTAGSYVS